MVAARNPEPEDETFVILRERCEKSCAERDAAIKALRCLLAVFDPKQHMNHDESVAYWNAKAVVEECG